MHPTRCVLGRRNSLYCRWFYSSYTRISFTLHATGRKLIHRRTKFLPAVVYLLSWLASLLPPSSSPSAEEIASAELAKGGGLVRPHKTAALKEWGDQRSAVTNNCCINLAADYIHHLARDSAGDGRESAKTEKNVRRNWNATDRTPCREIKSRYTSHVAMTTSSTERRDDVSCLTHFRLSVSAYVCNSHMSRLYHRSFSTSRRETGPEIEKEHISSVFSHARLSGVEFHEISITICAGTFVLVMGCFCRNALRLTARLLLVFLWVGAFDCFISGD